MHRHVAGVSAWTANVGLALAHGFAHGLAVGPCGVDLVVAGIAAVAVVVAGAGGGAVGVPLHLRSARGAGRGRVFVAHGEQPLPATALSVGGWGVDPVAGLARPEQWRPVHTPSWRPRPARGQKYFRCGHCLAQVAVASPWLRLRPLGKHQPHAVPPSGKRP